MPGAAQLSSWANWIPSTLFFLHATKFLHERPRQWLEMACSYHKGNSSSLHLIPCLDLKSGWERGQLGAGWTLPWNAMAGCFETTALPCGEQAAGRKQAHVLYRALTARQCAPTKHWSYHKLLHVYDQETPSSRKCLTVLCYTLGELFPRAKGPWAELRQPYSFPRKHQATSLPRNRPSQSFHHQETAQGPVSRSWAPMSICMCYVEQQQKACKQSPFFSPAFECLVPRLKLLSKYWFQLKKWSGNLSCCHFKQLSYSFPGFPRHLFSTWKKKSWGRAWRISNSFMLSRPAEAWSKLQKAPKAHMHPWHMHRNNCKHACSKPYTFRRNLSPYLFAELIHMQLRTSGQPTSNGSNTLPTLQACWACAVLQMWDSSGRDRCKQKYDSFKLSLKSLHHSN